MAKDKDYSDFLPDGFEGIENHFTNISVVSRSSHNMLLKALRFGQWWMLKCLLPEEKDQPVYQEMLRKEFEILMQMQHLNVVRAFSVENVKGWGPCIIMEWVEGETLLAFLNKQPDKHKLLKLAVEIAEAIEYIHKKGIVHRDIKPSNVMVTHNGENVKLIDFGLADSDIYAVLKQSGGTEGYMAPEQSDGDGPDIRNDIYSFGVILQQMNLGKQFDSIVNHCLEPIDRRYHNMTEVKEALSTKSMRSSKTVPRKWLWGMLALVIALAVVAAVSLYRLRAYERFNDPDAQDYDDYVPEDLTLGEEPTLKIVNPDFHGTKGYGWKYDSNSPPFFLDEGGISAGHFYIQTFDLWQTIHGLEPGRYEVRVSAFHRPDSGHWSLWHYEHATDQENGTVYSTAELYADTASVRLLNWAAEANSEPLPDDKMFFEEQVKDEIPNAIRAAGYYFNHGHYINMLEFTVGENSDSVRIGIRLTAMRPQSLSWVVFDRFRIRKLD